MKILFLGDLHGRFHRLSEFSFVNPDIIIQCGDFGYWPHEVNFSPLENLKTKLYWCDGNHEHFPLLKNIKNTDFEKKYNCTYMPRGSVLSIENTNILFFGGAYSIDRRFRIPEVSWFEDEVIKESDMYNIPENKKIDIIVSHTCPTSFKSELSLEYELCSDISEHYLNVLLEKYNPSYWIFGHFHFRKQGIYNNTKWICLPDVDSNQQRTFTLEIGENKCQVGCK